MLDFDPIAAVSTFRQQLVARARRAHKKILLSEGDDPRILQAAQWLVETQTARPIVLVASANQEPYRKLGIETILTDQPCVLKKQLTALWAQRFPIHQTRLHQPLILAHALVLFGFADGIVSGAVHTTPEVIRAAKFVLAERQPAQRTRTLSGYFLVIFDQPANITQRNFVFTDCGVNIEPNVDTLAQIAADAAEHATFFLNDIPKIAFLSFSTQGSASHRRVDAVRQSAQRLAQKSPKLLIDGEVQLDAAIVSDICARKMTDSKLNGQANVLVFPDLDSGNNAYKLAQRLGGALALGPLLHGLNYAVSDLSRGCSALDVFYVAAATALNATRRLNSALFP